MSANHAAQARRATLYRVIGPTVLVWRDLPASTPARATSVADSWRGSVLQCAQGDFVPGAYGPILGKLEHLVHRKMPWMLMALAISLGIQEAPYLGNRVKLAKRFKNLRLAVKLQIWRFAEWIGQARWWAAQPLRRYNGHRYAVSCHAKHPAVKAGECCQSCQSVGCNCSNAAFFDGNDGGHG